MQWENSNGIQNWIHLSANNTNLQNYSLKCDMEFQCSIQPVNVKLVI